MLCLLFILLIYLSHENIVTMKKTLFKSIFLSLFLVMHTASVHADWQRSITNYSRHSYKAASQNWMIKQHRNGWMYFANNKGLLEFDGTHWDTYPIYNAKMRALESSDKRIYAGGLQQFGYFEPNELGKLTYVCLSDSINKQTIGNIWQISATESSVCFQSDNRIFLYENDRIIQIPCNDIVYSTLINGHFYIATTHGIYILNGHTLTELPHTNQVVINFSEKRIVGMFMYKGQPLIVNRQGELLYYEAESWKRVYQTELKEVLQNSQLFCSALCDHILALGTIQNGVILLNLETGMTEHISTDNGLQNKTILSLTFDRDRNLWLGLDNGIDCIHLHSPLLHSGPALGSGYTSCLYQGKLYLGTNQGVFISDYPIVPNKQHHIKAIPQIIGQIYSMTVYDNQLFCAGSNELMVIDGTQIYQVPSIRGVWWIKSLPSTDKLLAATYTGLYLLKKENGKWTICQKVKGGSYSSKTLYIEPMTGVLWTANKEGGLHRILLSADNDSIIRTRCYNSPQLPTGNNVHVATVNGEIVIASRNGLFKYNPLKDELERHHELEQLLDGNMAYTYIKQDSLRNIWYVTDGILKLLRYNTHKGCFYRNKNEELLRDYLIEDFEHVNVLANGDAFIGTEEGFSLFHFHEKPQFRHMPDLQVRYLYLTGIRDSLIYGQSYLPNHKRIQIPYTNNSIRIEYSSDSYDKSLTFLYSCRLEGPIHTDWSQPSENMMKEYTMLPKGTYTFYVRTSIDNEKSVMASCSFEILPPWYQTWWFMLACLLLGLSLMYYFYHAIQTRQKQALMMKELELYRQKQEFQKEGTLKDQRINSLKEENLQAELRHKSEELISKTLNVVRKNEILQDIRKEVLNISHSIKEENLVAIRRKTLRLINQIDTNIEHDDDLQAFQSSFDSVHHGFFRRLEEQYPELTHRDKLLCAYIKMNLLSKEIAPLMNISLRGVEISRYRLRKKLNLSEGENLVEFLQQFGK